MSTNLVFRARPILFLSASTVLLQTRTPVQAALSRAAPQRVQIDNQHATWRTIDEQLHRIAEAERKKDIDALRSIYSPDFISVQRNGERWDVERVLAFQANSLKKVEQTIC